MYEDSSMRDYKGWTAKERLASLKKTKTAIAAGTIPSPTKCNRCGKTTGRIDYHNHDYSDPIKYLEQICQGCHTRLHRLENLEMEGKDINEVQSTVVKEVVSDRPVTKEIMKSPIAEIREDVHKIRVAFTKALGLNWSENLNPRTGYKFERDSITRQRFLDEARELRKQYAELVAESGKGNDILDKMDRNLVNRDRGAIWK
jgi:hypothetical protein